ncbi:MAG: RNA polymerase sigma factor [Paenisporosarcina sp.]
MSNESLIIGGLYDEFHKDVYHFALYFTNNKQDAEDITQETFIKVLNNLHQLKDQSKKKAWILSIARNTAVDLIRKQKLIRFLPSLIKKESTPNKTSSTSRNIIAEENWVELQKSLLKIKPHYRSVIILRSLSELSLKEIAEALGCSEGKVRVDFHRALNILKNDVSLKEGWEQYGQSR